MKKIFIAGLGWLGRPLALLLQEQGWQVSGCCTSNEKAKTLEEDGISTIKYVSGEPLPDFSQAETIIINFPPSQVENGIDQEVERWMSKVKMDQRVIFISSTSVFGESQGVCNESTIAIPGKRGELLQKAEQEVLKSNRSVVIRPAGLFGPNRNPGLFFRTKKPAFGGNECVNLIDQDQLMQLICQVLRTPEFFGALHAVLPDHPQKAEFYSKAFALFSGGKHEAFEQSEVKKFKKVQSVRLEELNFRYAETSILALLQRYFA